MSYLGSEIKKEVDIKEELDREEAARKILFLGLTQVGKTSIIKTIFEGRAPEDTNSLVATVRLERTKYNYRDHIIFTYDVGGQKSYLEEAIEINKKEIFSKVRVMLFVIDISNVGTFTSSRQYLHRAIRKVFEFSDNPKIYILAHKIDLIDETRRVEAIRILREYLNLDKLKNIRIFQTSIFDDSTIKAFDEIL